MDSAQKVVPFLWFDGQGEEAVNFYASIFRDVKIDNISRYNKATAEVSGKPEGSVVTVKLELFNQGFVGCYGKLSTGEKEDLKWR